MIMEKTMKNKNEIVFNNTLKKIIKINKQLMKKKLRKSQLKSLDYNLNIVLRDIKIHFKKYKYPLDLSFYIDIIINNTFAKAQEYLFLTFLAKGYKYRTDKTGKYLLYKE